MGSSREGGWLAQGLFPDSQHISCLCFPGITCETHTFPKTPDDEDLGQNRESEPKNSTDPVGAIPKPPDRLKFFTLNA